ncbi:unnamed protein product [Prorocentrum cordatum]|uniref:Uncharacterized protein n=1 Tax=Prorocentrum cordatum TaxID=2364126 RepID=A0ABN9XCY2_9DINO|nr:unnamed protein product [Polarella glacialis]
MLAAASVGRRRRELRHGRPLASRRLWERQRAVGKRRQRRAGGGRESPALPPRGVSAPPPPCPRAESRGERWGSKEEEEDEDGEEALPSVSSLRIYKPRWPIRPALAQRQQSRRPQTGGRADPDTHTHTHTHTQHNKKTPGLVKRARASGPSVGGGPTRRSSKREQKQELSEVHANLIS